MTFATILLLDSAACYCKALTFIFKCLSANIPPCCYVMWKSSLHGGSSKLGNECKDIRCHQSASFMEYMEIIRILLSNVFSKL